MDETSMIERVGKVIFKALIATGGPGATMMPWPLCPEYDWCIATAMAAIGTMREPTFDMVEAGQQENNILPEPRDPSNAFVFLSRDEMTGAWEAMIDAALSQAIGNKESGDDGLHRLV